MAKIEPEESRISNPDTLESQVREYAKVKASMEVLESRSKELRNELFTHLDTAGFEDDKGNIQLELAQPIDGVVRLEKQRRVTRKIDEGRADEILQELGLSDEVYEVKRVVNEDALMAAYYEGKISEDQLDEMFPANVVWALRALKK